MLPRWNPAGKRHGGLEGKKPEQMIKGRKETFHHVFFFFLKLQASLKGKLFFLAVLDLQKNCEDCAESFHIPHTHCLMTQV